MEELGSTALIERAKGLSQRSECICWGEDGVRSARNGRLLGACFGGSESGLREVVRALGEGREWVAGCF